MADSPPGPGQGPDPSDTWDRQGESRIEPVDPATPFHHVPVLEREVVALSENLPAGPFLDATLGGAGHAVAVLAANPTLRLIGVDRDPAALAAAGERLASFGDRVALHRCRFDHIDAALVDDEDSTVELSGFLFDLGVSSPQLDQAERGFSFRHGGPLDMRMDPDAELDASQVVNEYEQRDLAELIHRFSDERFASRIAAAIVAARPLSTTGELADAIVAAIPAPARRRGGHPAKRTFQAIRIEVNDELRILGPALDRVLDSLAPGGRGMVITYHSGEDRITKDTFRRRTAVEQPPGLPVEVERPDFEIVRPMVRRPSTTELETNPRSASARLRCIERAAA